MPSRNSHRPGWRAFWGDFEHWLLSSAPVRPSAARSLACAWGTSSGIAFITGCVLALHYLPISGRAWESVWALQGLAGGGTVRAVHRGAAEVALVTGVWGLVLAAVERRDEREGTALDVRWAAALGVGLTLLLCVTGNPLRFDNASYFALQVESSVLGTLPGIGGFARRLFVGSGSEEGLPARLYVRHSVLLPALFVLVLAASAAARRLIPKGHPEVIPRDGAVRQSVRDITASLVALLVVSLSAVVRGAPLGSPADPNLSFPARPVWYLQALFVAREALPSTGRGWGLLLGLLLFVSAAVFEYAKRRSGSAAERRLFRIRVIVASSAIGYLTLTVVGLLRERRDPVVRAYREREIWDIQRVEALSHGGAVRDARALLDADPLHRARGVFAEHCANCHAIADLHPPVGGMAAPALDGFGRRRWVLDVLDDPDASHLFGGTPFAGTMHSMTRAPKDPEQRAKFHALPEPERVAIAAFLESQAFGVDANSVSRAQLEQGEQLVAQRCTSCHLFRGLTDDEEGDAPELSGWGSEDYIRAQILNPMSGTTYRRRPRQKGQMPGYAGLLSAEEIDLLIALIRNQIGANEAQERSAVTD